MMIVSCGEGRPSGLTIKNYRLDPQNHGHLAHGTLALFSDKTLIAATSLWDEDMQNQGVIEFEEQIRFYRMPLRATKPEVRSMGKGKCIGFAGNDSAMVCALLRKIPSATEEVWRTVFYLTTDKGIHWDSTGLLPFRIKHIYPGYAANRILLVTEVDENGNAEILFSRNFGATCELLCHEFNPTGLQETADILLMHGDSTNAETFNKPYIHYFDKVTQQHHYLNYINGFRPGVARMRADGSIITAGDINGKLYTAERKNYKATAHYLPCDQVNGYEIHTIYTKGQETLMFGSGAILYKSETNGTWEHHAEGLGNFEQEVFVVNPKLMAGLGYGSGINNIQLIHVKDSKN
jgi:hypothetical protein